MRFYCQRVCARARASHTYVHVYRTALRDSSRRRFSQLESSLRRRVCVKKLRIAEGIVPETEVHPVSSSDAGRKHKAELFPPWFPLRAGVLVSR